MKRCRFVALLLALAPGLSVPAAAGGMGKAGAGVTVSAGGFHWAAIREDGSLWMWGASYTHIFSCADFEGEALGRDRAPCRSAPIKVMDGVAAVDVSKSAAALRTDGTLWTWGSNSYGQLGMGTQSAWEAEPTQMLAMLCRAAGAQAGGETWSAQALAWAEEAGLTDGLKFAATDPRPRADTVYCMWKQMN